MDFKVTEIPGCYLLSPFHHSDERGEFVKLYNSDQYLKEKLDFHIKEIYFSVSHKNVFRGFHFQAPPTDHTKIVNCIKGSIIDFVLDLRAKSPTHGKCIGLEINDQNKHGVYIPKGCAHAFLSLENDSMVTYLQETVYAPDSDSGILWSSVDIPHKISNPILSERDQSFPSLQHFKSPFL